MYPALTTPLLAVLGLAAGALVALLVRRPMLRRLALRQVSRRRTEAALVISGSLLGTAIIVAALVVGDTLGHSVRQTAFTTLGPIDERVVSSSVAQGRAVDAALTRGLARNSDVDGVLSALFQPSAAAAGTRSSRVAEPRVLAWEVDFAAAKRFGGESGGLAGVGPGPGEVVINANLARALEVRQGSTLTLYISGQARELRVARVLAVRGLAGTGFGATENRNAFLPQGTLPNGIGTRGVTWVSNRGGVRDGNALTTRVSRAVEVALGPLGRAVAVDTPKREVLRAADRAADSLGALFLMIGSFSIIAGALLLVNIFVMLAEERKAQLGILRAAGLKRSGLVGAFAIEGAAYAAIATGLGVVVGIGVGSGVAFLAARIFSSWSTDGSGLNISFAVTPTSLINGAALGLVISLSTVLLTSVRISRVNIIAAIRDLESPASARTRRRLRLLGAAVSILFGVAAVPAVVASDGIGTFLLPALALVCLVPILVAALGSRAAYSLVSGAVLLWTLLADVIRPRVFDTPSMAVYVVMGCQLAFSAVVLLSQNEELLVRGLGPLMRRPTEGALAGRLALAYPLAKRFRTGATLIMYTLIMLVLVLLTEIGGVLHASIDTQVRTSTAGYDLRVDVNPQAGAQTLNGLRARYPGNVEEVALLTSAVARSTDPGHRSAEPIQTIVIGVPAGATDTMAFEKRLPGLETDAAVWRDLAIRVDDVVLDPFFGATGGPAGAYYVPGDEFDVTDPKTGVTRTKRIVGILRNATVFYSPSEPAAFPLVTSTEGVQQHFGASAQTSSALVRVSGSDPAEHVAGLMQADALSAGLVATPVVGTIRRLFDANLAFFRLMQGFLALGLLIGIAGLGIVMVRAVRERRRTIGILRALGFRARSVERAFLLESLFIAVQGVVLGTVLGLLTTWLMYQRSAAFSGIRTGFPIEWATISVLAVGTVVASLLATASPARHAARILPAVATRTNN